MKSKAKPPKFKRGNLYQIIMSLNLKTVIPDLYLKEGEAQVRKLSTDEEKVYFFIIAQLEALLEFHVKPNVDSRNLELILDFAEAAANKLLQMIDKSFVRKELYPGPFGFRRNGQHTILLVTNSQQRSKETDSVHLRLLLPYKYKETIYRVKKLQKTGPQWPVF